MAKLPVSDFITTRLKEFDSKLDTRKGTGFHQLFINPMQFMMQPLVDEALELTIAQSFLRILQQADPDAFPEEPVDALAANLYVTRNPGSLSSGVARIAYPSPVNREWPANGTLITGSNGKTYTNPAPFFISTAQMGTQVENGLYYYDIPVVSTELGSDSDLEEGGLVGIDNDTEATTVYNVAPITGGAPKETNTQLIERTRQSIAVRDLVTGKGFNATMFENFVGSLTELQPIGFGDREMMRDILFNAHVGGKVDGYFKTASIRQGYKTFVGLLPDDTRQTESHTNIVLWGTDNTLTGDGNFDISNAKIPIVEQIKAKKAPKYLSPVDMSNPLDLTLYYKIRLKIDGVTSGDINLRGAIPGQTNKAEIISRINGIFGYPVAFSVGNSIELRGTLKGAYEEISIMNPIVGGSPVSALASVFGLFDNTSFYGEGPATYSYGTHYDIDVFNGGISRVVGDVKVSGPSNTPLTTGACVYSGGVSIFTDPTPDVFSVVLVDDIVTINPNSTNTLEPPLPATPPAALPRRDYRVISKVDNNTLVLDEVVGYRGTWDAAANTPKLINGTGYIGDSYKVVVEGITDLGSGSLHYNRNDYVMYDGTEWQKIEPPLGPFGSGLNYIIRRTGIKEGETVSVNYWFNPLSIDVGPLVKNTDPITGKVTRGIRPGRELQTITDVSFLRINKVEIIDPITLEPTGEVLYSRGGFGQGGFGEGPYGSGGGSDYRFVVNQPTERFSVFEDSMIIFDPAFIAMSFRIDYDYTPECTAYHDFVRSENERVLDGDILMKHFLPAYVGGTINYKVDSTDSAIPDNDTLTTMVKSFISSQRSGTELKISDVYQFLARSTDPHDRYGSYISPFELEATIHNADGTTTIISSKDKLIVPEENPFPIETTRPLTARITHWIGDNIILVRS